MYIHGGIDGQTDNSSTQEAEAVVMQVCSQTGLHSKNICVLGLQANTAAPDPPLPPLPAGAHPHLHSFSGPPPSPLTGLSPFQHQRKCGCANGQVGRGCE